jgi:vacuolar protein sorting-associated protein 13A/C
MNTPSDAVSFLENMDVSLSLDNRTQSGHDTMTIDLNLQPIIIRASLRDINLILAIFSRAAELSAQNQTKNTPMNSGMVDSAVTTTSMSSTPPKVTAASSTQGVPPQATLIVTNETVRPIDN